MSITDELRKLAKTLTHWWYDPVKDEYTYTTGTMPPSIDAIRMDSNIIAIVDRIDAAHEAKVADVASGWDYWESTHVELPKDADGVPIRIGDKLIDEDDKPQKPAIVKCILYNDEGCVVSDIDPRGCWYGPSLLRHYHAPTVEDVLREFADEVYADADNEIRDRDFLCAKYAKRLTLAETEDA